jgi:hypothetical protein
MNTDNNSFAESLEKMARDMECPPLNGGPTQEEIIKALNTAAKIIGEHEADKWRYARIADRNQELESTIHDVTSLLDAVIRNMSRDVMLEHVSKVIDDAKTTMKKIRFILRRA